VGGPGWLGGEPMELSPVIALGELVEGLSLHASQRSVPRRTGLGVAAAGRGPAQAGDGADAALRSWSRRASGGTGRPR
jgi:hypothetical protein